MKITIISASMRANSQSLKVSEWLSEHVSSMGAQAKVLDLQKAGLPMYDGSDEMALKAKSILVDLSDSDGFVFVSPEWNGTMSHGLVNLLHFVDHEMAHKPVMLVGVSAGSGGHYPIMQMRIMNYKNNHFVISPEALLVQDVNNMLNDHEPSDGASGSVKKRADYALRILIAYSESLRTVRGCGIVNFKEFRNGV